MYIEDSLNSIVLDRHSHSSAKAYNNGGVTYVKITPASTWKNMEFTTKVHLTGTSTYLTNTALNEGGLGFFDLDSTGGLGSLKIYALSSTYQGNMAVAKGGLFSISSGYT